jgi:hypothetical protein
VGRVVGSPLQQQAITVQGLERFELEHDLFLRVAGRAG